MAASLRSQALCCEASESAGEVECRWREVASLVIAAITGGGWYGVSVRRGVRRSAGMSVAVGLFAVAGCAVVATLITDFLWALLLGLRAHLLPKLHFFSVDLKRKYGSWAGQ